MMSLLTLKNEFADELTEYFFEDQTIISLLYEFHDHQLFRNLEDINKEENTDFNYEIHRMFTENQLSNILFKMYYNSELNSDLDIIRENIIDLLTDTQQEIKYLVEDALSDFDDFDESDESLPVLGTKRLELRHEIIMIYYHYYDFKLTGLNPDRVVKCYEHEELQLS